MENIFRVGVKVKGDSFIGRKKLLRDLKSMFFTKGVKITKAIVGVKRSGKSSLVLNIFEDIPSDIIYIYENLNEYGKYIELWRDIFDQISEYLGKTNKLSKYALKEINNNLSIISQSDVEWNKFKTSVKNIFRSLSAEKIKSIIVLDEFDNAKQLFTETQYWELFRSIFSEPNYDVSAVTISRKSLPVIEGDIPQSSTFHGIFDTIDFDVFDDDDMEEYFQVFEDNGIELDEKQQEEIEYYCGRLPYLLSIMGQNIFELAEDNEKIDIKKIFEKKSKLIDSYYKECKKYLENGGKISVISDYFEEHKSEFDKSDEFSTKIGFSIPKTEAEWKKLIYDGETENVEFKSTLQYDIKKKSLNSILRMECIKTVSAFLNTDGGILFIGIDDDFNILGLNNDYSVMPKEERNKDSFELKLRDILGSACGTINIAGNVKIKFPIIDEKEICVVVVYPSSKPVYTQENRDKIFYVRSGNSTRKLDISEVTDYVNSHFKK